MINSLTEDRICKLADMVRHRFGLDFAPNRWKDLRTAVILFHREESPANTVTASDCLDHILSRSVGDKDLEQFINRLTIGETFFFRDSKALNVLEHEILRKLSGTGSGINGAIRIWSTACSTGEEPYTIAMICRRSGLKADIYGTDIDSHALIKAQEGCYRRWSFRSADTGFRDIFFRKVGANSYLIDSSIKKMVNLSRLNLMDSAVPSSLMDMDVVLCRNVLMYFSPSGVNNVLDKIWNCLTPGGWLIATPSESALLTSHGKFEPVNLDGALFFRKNEQYKPFRIDFTDQSPCHGDCDFHFAFPGLCFGEQSQEEVGTFAEIDIPIHEPEDTPVEQAEENCPVEGEDVDGAELLEQGRNLRLQGDFAGALACYEKNIGQEHAQDIRAAALLEIAGVKADSGFADEAARWCERAIELDRIAPQAHFLLGQICLQQGDRDRAVAEMRNAVFLDSGFIMGHVLLGNVYLENKDKNAALRHFRIALQELEKVEHDETVPFSDNITAGRLMEMVRLVKDHTV
ncbi:CheR family methyltransferase [Maridesulfovibrio sp.]|uniref:CheR family methyltransferase n=1 Tax=Maridesulfovibrio sp. TaxID=2795000 RepID=UPI0029C9F1DD|nr:CheR family methyltransferase [Maridesulfovibrio sp.]